MADFFALLHSYTWLLLPTLAAFMWAMNNHIDKGMLSHFFKDDGGIGGLIIVSAIASIIATPFLWYMDKSVFATFSLSDPNDFIEFIRYRSSGDAMPAEVDVKGVMSYLIAITSMFDILVLWCYLKALQKDEPTQVIIYYQLVPLFGVLAGWLLLGETISSAQGMAMTVILIGTTMMTFGLVKGKVSFQWNTFIFMVPAAAIWALELAVFKFAALEVNEWHALFWKHIALALVGVTLFIIVPSYRKSFLFVMKSNSAAVLGLNLFNEATYMVGTISVAVAVMPQDVAIVLVPETFQPIFVFALAALLVKFLPKYAPEDFDLSHTIKKMAAIAVTLCGTYLLILST
jgi:drug/metabolite transporter (DMT)-like permease